MNKPTNIAKYKKRWAKHLAKTRKQWANLNSTCLTNLTTLIEYCNSHQSNMNERQLFQSQLNNMFMLGITCTRKENALLGYYLLDQHEKVMQWSKRTGGQFHLDHATMLRRYKQQGGIL